MSRDEVREAVLQVLADHFALDRARVTSDDQSFLGSGIIDSAGIVRFMSLIEQRFSMILKDEEIVAENFDSVAKATAFIRKRLFERTLIH